MIQTVRCQDIQVNDLVVEVMRPQGVSVEGRIAFKVTPVGGTHVMVGYTPFDWVVFNSSWMATVDRPQQYTVTSVVHVTGSKTWTTVRSVPPWAIDKPDLGVDSDRFPHLCPHCKAPAYVGLNDIDCSRGCT
jgi:hypothetical protein